jgi:hypothetical protein
MEVPWLPMSNTGLMLRQTCLEPERGNGTRRYKTFLLDSGALAVLKRCSCNRLQRAVSARPCGRTEY